MTSACIRATVSEGGFQSVKERRVWPMVVAHHYSRNSTHDYLSAIAPPEPLIRRVSDGKAASQVPGVSKSVIHRPPLSRTSSMGKVLGHLEHLVEFGLIAALVVEVEHL
jgi:hypothetical protein